MLALSNKIKEIHKEAAATFRSPLQQSSWFTKTSIPPSFARCSWHSFDSTPAAEAPNFGDLGGRNQVTQMSMDQWIMVNPAELKQRRTANRSGKTQA